MEDGESGAPTAACASGMGAALESDLPLRVRTPALPLRGGVPLRRRNSKHVGPEGAACHAGAETSLGLARRLVLCDREPLALVTRLHVVLANGPFCRWAGLAVDAGSATALSNLFSPEDQALLFDADSGGAGQEGAWLELPFLGPHLPWVEARALRMEGGGQPHWLLSLAEPVSSAAGEQAMTRLAHWAAIGLSASTAPRTSAVFSGRADDPFQRAWALPPAPTWTGPGRGPDDASITIAVPSWAERVPAVGSAAAAVDVNRVVMRAIDAEKLPGACRAICQFEPLPPIVVDEAQLLLALRCLLEHVASTLQAPPGERSGPAELCVRSERGEHGLQVWVQTRCAQPAPSPQTAQAGDLLLAQRVLQALGGWLQVELSPSGGLAYGLHVPWAAMDEAEVALERRQSAMLPERPLLRLLIIDADRAMTGRLRRALRHLGQVDAVSDGQAAIALLTLDGHFDVILCDEHTTDGSGVQVCRWLATYRPALLGRLLLMRQGDHGLSPEGVAVIHKPVDLAAVLDPVEELSGS